MTALYFTVWNQTLKNCDVFGVLVKYKKNAPEMKSVVNATTLI